jgi:hypothetical protein
VAEAPPAPDDRLDAALKGMALGRLGLGVPARLAPRLSTWLSGLGGSASPGLDYMMQVFGVRAVALGAGYLSTDGEARRRWQRLAFMCDVSDTLAGLGHIRRRELPLPAAVGLTLLTGTYAVLGGAKIRCDMRSIE